MENERLTYSPTETALVLGVSRPTVYSLMRREGFPCFKIGTRTLVSVEGLREWVRKQTGGGHDDE